MLSLRKECSPVAKWRLVTQLLGLYPVSAERDLHGTVGASKLELEVHEPAVRLYLLRFP